MKKIFFIILCLMLVGMVFLGTVPSAQAAGNAHMSIRSSSGTLHRGDSFTLTVSLSNDQPISNGGLILSYDSNVFEFLGGSCHVSNAPMSEVSASRNGGVFVLQTDAVVSGTIFTINMRVKNTASFGSYTISGSPSLSGASCTLSGTNVTIACRHSYGNASKVDNNSHESTCTICGKKEKTNHTWNSGTVIKAATCKDTGTKRLTCTGCSATREETIPVTDNHKYSAWSKTSDTKHSRTCSVCAKKETASHTWNSGTVIEKATCQQTGTRKLTCTKCSATKTETIPIGDHAYTECVFLDGTNHTRTCTVCSKVLTEAHQYGSDWKHDANQHLRRCAGCGNEIEQGAHIPGPKATETTDQVCTVCNRILQPKGDHVHSFSQDWSQDAAGHWHACDGCNEKGSAAAHDFDSNCDSDCNTCGMTRQPAHIPGGELSSDSTGHWYACAECGEKVDFASHIPGQEATISSAQTCTLCGFEIEPALPHEHMFDHQGSRHIHTCPCGETCEAEAGDCHICAGFPWWILCIVEALIICGLLGGGYFWLKKRGLRLF